MTFWGRMRTRWLGGSDGPKLEDGTQITVPVSGKAPAAAVNFDTAMSVSAFWASARLISETIAAMPLVAYRTDGESVTADPNYPLWRLLNYQPNQYQTRTEFFETMVLNLVTTGNAYGAIQRFGDRITAILPLMSSQMEVDLLDGEQIYRYYDESGNVRIYARESIWHIKLFGNGLVGLSPLGYARQSLGIAIATGDRASQLAASGGKSNGILMVDKLLTPEQRQAIRKNLGGLTEGRSDELFVLEASMKFERTGLSPQDMQLLETRRFQIEDIARFMGVPSVLINDTNGTTAWGSGIRQIMEGFYKLNLRPYLERIESSMKRHLIPVADWSNVDLEFDFDSLLRADKPARYDGYNKAINAGVMTPNEARKEEGLPPLAGGERIYLNGSLTPAEAADGAETPEPDTD
jgi:HK97 family phage portal protein